MEKGTTKNNSKERAKWRLIKSPSDMTIYTQALRRNPPEGNPVSSVANIANIVESLRMDADHGQPEPCSSTDEDHGNTNSDEHLDVPGFVEAHSNTEQAIIQAEKYKAVIAEPPGEQREGCSSLPRVKISAGGMTDDDFFHLTCHVEPGIQTKIERGEYVELEKLLPKDKRRKSDRNLLEWVQNEGSTFLSPMADRDNKISNFHIWEQAFRVYATIYCGANPHRSK